MSTTPFDTPRLSPAKLALLQRRLRGEGIGGDGGIPRRPAGAPVPLPPAQHALWVVDQVLPDNSVYSVHRQWWLRGPLDTEALHRSLDELVSRHEILRTTYVDAGENEPVQVIGPDRGAAFRVVDLTTGERAGERATAMAEEDLRRGFDLAAGPVLRASLFRVDTEEHLLLLNIHHMACDGWSCAVLGRELAALYSANTRGTPVTLPRLEIQYADYARWQADRVRGELCDRQLDHWRRALDGIRPTLALPTDFPYPAEASYRAKRVNRTLSAATTAAVRGLSRRHGVTLFTTLLAAFGVVLRKCCGQDTFSVGSLTSGRDRAEVANLVGLFANTVPIPADLSGDPTFAEHLDRTYRAVLGALDHQDVSFEQIVTAVAPVREPARNPLFQVLFQLLEQGEEDWRFDGLAAEHADLHNDTGKVDLALFAFDSGERVELEVDYSTDLFRAETAARFADRVVAVLQRVVTDPGVRLSNLDVLADRERTEVTTGWNDTAAEYPRATLPELFETAVRRAPDAVAVSDVDGSTVTYADLNARANRLAHHLRALGIGAESVVGVCVEHCVDMFVALLGVLKAGAAYVPLDPEHPTDRLAFMLSDTGARVVVTHRAAAAAVPAEFDGTLVLVAGLPDDLPEDDPVPVTGPDNLVYVMYTSGSTGRPKGVMISHAGLVNYLWWAIDGYGLGGASGAPMLGSIAFDLSVPNFFLPLIGGKDVTLLPRDKSLTALADLLRGPGDHSLLKLTPGHLDVLRGMIPDPDSVHCVRTFVVGADEVRPETVAAWRKVAPDARIIDEYGPTETVVGCSTYLVDDDFDPSVPVSIGRPIANIRMYVLDERLEPVPVGAVGELCIGGAGVARGYLNRRGLTAEKFVPDPFAATPGERMYRTGDLARFRTDGDLDFLGRIDHQVKILGYRIELGEIEARLLLHDRVSEAVVAAREDTPGHKRLVAYVVAHAGKDLDVDELRGFAARSLPTYMVPRVWLVLDRMPLTAAGKVDRTALPDPEPAGPAVETPRPTSADPTEAGLAEIWARSLGLDEVGAHDDFFDLGGDSILAIQIAARARKAGFAVTVRQVFEHRTVAALAAAVGSTTAVAVRADQHLVSGTVALTPMLRWFTEHTGLRHDHLNQSIVLDCDPAVDPDVVARALAAVVEHHDMLRLRLSRVDGQWQAVVAGTEPHRLVRVVDLAGHPEIRDRVGHEIQSGLSLADGPIVAAALFTDGDRATQLMIAIHHVAVDTVSWGILLEDLDTACQQLEAGQPITLPAKSTSFQYWAKRLTDHANSPEFTTEATYWARPAPSSVPIPVDHDRGPNCEASNRVVAVTLPADRTDALLRRVPAAYRTEINDVLLAALTRTLTEWTGGDSVLVELEGHGREPLFDDVDLSRTVGWFTSVLPVDLPLAAGGWGDQLKATKALLRAVPRHGIGYGLARHLREDTAAELATRPEPALSFNYLGRLDRQRDTGGRFHDRSETLGTDHDPAGERPHLIGVTALVNANTLRVYWSYSANRHATDTVRRVAERYLAHLTDLIDHCLADGPGRATPGDFPLAGLDQPTLDGLLARLPVPAGEVEDLYPLSPLQSGMLFRSIFDPESADYFEQTGLVLRGEFDVDVFEAAWQRVVDRHPALRTIFAWEGLPHALQVVPRHQPVRLDRLDWTGADPDEIADRLGAELRAHRATGFDIATRCASRFTTIRTSATEHYFVWSLHHILLDAWSANAVLSEVLATYRALRAGHVPEPAAVTPFRDYIAWVGGQDRAADSEFWRAELAGLTAPTLLAPTTPIAADPGEAHVGDELTQELATALRSLAAHIGCTVGSVLQAAWALALALHTGRRDVVFGTTVTGRTAAVAGIEHMIGMLINTLPSPVLVDPDRTVTGYLADQQARQLAQREHEHCSLNEVQRHAPVPPGTALFDTFFSYRNFSGGVAGDTPSDTELDVSPLPHDFEQTDCPLMLNVNHRDTVRLTVAYRRSLFDEATCVAMLKRYVAVLRDLAAHPEARLGEVPTLAPLGDVPAPGSLGEVAAVHGAKADHGPPDSNTEPATGHAEPTAGRVEPDTGHDAPRDDLELAIAEIWAKVLGLDEVGAHDDFFDLGGDSIVAIQIVAEARRIGVPVTLPRVFQHRTVARLAQAIADTDTDTAAPVLADQHAVSGAVALTPILRWFTDRPIHHDHYNQSVLLDCQPAVHPEVLSRALAALVDHHDALRIRLSTVDGRWTAELRNTGTEPRLRVVDLTGTRRHEVRARVAHEIQSGLSITDGPVLAAALFTDGDRATQLMIAIHHVAVDTVSWGILLEDLDTACQQLEAGQPITLPAKSTSFQYWAKRLTDHANSPEFTAEATYWTDKADESAPAIPVDHDDGPNTGNSYRSVTATLPAEITDTLVHRVPAAYRTQINDVLLTALAHTVTEWTGGSRALVALEGHGREQLFDDVDLSRTVGWFANLVPVALPAVGGGWGTALKAVKELLRAVPHHGIGHGLARYLRTDTSATLAATPEPQLLFNYVGRLDQRRGTARDRFTESPDQLAADRDGDSPRSFLIEVEAEITDGQLRVHWGYSTHRHRDDTMHGLAQRYVNHLTELVEHCAAGASGATPSDFPLVDVDQRTLDGVLAGLPGAARDVEDVYPLSPLQSGMLFHVLGAADPADYLVQKAYFVTGALDTDAFAAAWQRVVDRHAVLRTTFAWDGLPQPVQVVWRHRPVEFDELDWTGVDPAALPDRVQARLRRDLRAGFDLMTESPSRLTVIATRNGHYVLWNLHHIVLDAWSASTVLDEVLADYAVAGVANPPAVAPFRDHIAWITSRDRESDAGFWRTELAGLTAPVPLSTGSVVDGSGAGQVFGELPAELVTGLHGLAARCRSTVGTVLQAAWALLLSGHTGSRDVVFGTTVTGRAADVPGVERMVGMLLNTLPVRVRVDPDQPLVEFVAARQAAQPGLREREHCALADIHRWSPVPAGTPLFDTLVNYENFVGRATSGAGRIELDPVPASLTRTGQPLVVDLNQHDRIEMTLTYDRSRFDEAGCARLLVHFGQLVRGMVEAPDAPLDEFLARIPAVPRTSGGAPAPRRVEARTGTERVLAEVWTRLLDVEQVGVHEDFFDAGGNSVLIFQMVRMAQQAGVAVTVRQALRHRTIAGLAATVAPAVTTGTPGGEIPLPPAVRRFVDLDVDHDRYTRSVLLTWARPPAPDLLERALQAVIAHHDGLRLRLSGQLTVAEPTDAPVLWVADNSVEAVVDELGVSLSRGPLLRAALFPDPPARLLLVAHRLAVDPVSWSILLDDLATAYRQLDRGAEITLPPVGTPYGHWARRQADYAGTTMFAEQNAYWLARRPRPAVLPVDHPDGHEGARRVVESTLPAGLTEALLRTFDARAAEVLLSAVVAALARWTDSQDIVVDVESDGREPLTDDVDLSRTVGWLSVVHPLHIHLPEPHTPVRRLTAVREQLRAVPQHGIGHGLLNQNGPLPQVLFTYQGSGRLNLGPNALFDATAEPPTSERDPQPHLLTVDAGVSGGQATVRWTYSADTHDRATIDRIAGYCLDELQALAEWRLAVEADPGPGAVDPSPAVGNHLGPAVVGGPGPGADDNLGPGADVPSPAVGDPSGRLAERLFPHAPALIVPMARHRVPGAGVVLIGGGEVRAAWGEGVTGGEQPGPVGPDTLFQVGSISKHVTTAGVLRLVQDGRLDLDEDVARYLTSWRLPEGEPVTLRHLLGHTSGLWSETFLPVRQPRGTVPDLRPVLDSVLRGRPPETGWRYSPAGYGVVEQVVTDATGVPFPDLMRSQVFDPLGMADSGFEYDFPESRPDRVAFGHNDDGAPFPGGWLVAADVASSGLWATPRDLATLELAVLRAANGAETGFLSREHAMAMVTPAANGQYGLGTTTNVGPDAHWFGHPGDRHGYQGFTAVDLNSGSGLVLLTNMTDEAPLLANVISELGLDIHYRLRDGELT